jgi:alkyl hydroperoxide reductase subunit AhpF
MAPSQPADDSSLRLGNAAAKKYLNRHHSDERKPHVRATHRAARALRRRPSSWTGWPDGWHVLGSAKGWRRSLLATSRLCAQAKHVENFIGWQVISGPELIDRFREHINAFDVDCFEGNLVNAILPSGDDGAGFQVLTREGLALSTSMVIIATGKAPARLAIAGEDELVGRGVSYCATCDAAFFVGKAAARPPGSPADAALEL